MNIYSEETEDILLSDELFDTEEEYYELPQKASAQIINRKVYNGTSKNL